MEGSIIPIGHESYLPANKILAILTRDTTGINPMISKAELNQKLINATRGRSLKTVILTTDNYVVLSSIAPKTIAERYAREEGKPIMSIGEGNFLPNKIVTAFLPTGSAPLKELIKLARGEDNVIKATMGKKTKGIIVTSSGYFILTFLTPKTLASRFSKTDSGNLELD